MTFEEEYQDVLQNIEFAIVNIYRRYAELTDHKAAGTMSPAHRR